MPIGVTKTKPEFVDERGVISRIVDQDEFPLRAILYITGKKGTERGNHWHKTDYHYVYCVSGRFEYWEKDMNDPNSKAESVVLEPGDLVLSKPGMAHAMKFLEDTEFFAFTTERREQNKYEQDTVRVKITPGE